MEADVRYPTDAGLASHGVKVLAREAKKVAALVSERKARVRDRSRSIGRKLRALTRTIRIRSGEAKAEVLALTEQTGELLERSVKEARKLAAVARRRAGRACRRSQAPQRLDELADRCGKVASQIRQRVKGEPITDRLVSLADSDARPIRKGKLGEPNEFGVHLPDLRDDRTHPAWRARPDPRDLDPDRRHQPRVRNLPETVRDVRLCDPPPAVPRLINENLERVVLRSPGPKPKRARQKVRLEDRLNHDLRGSLDDTVADSGNRQRPPLTAARLRDEHPAGRPRSVAAVLQIRGQLVTELGDAVLLDVSDGLSVDASRALVGAHQLPRPLQDISAVDLVIERVEPTSGVGLGRPVERSL